MLEEFMWLLKKAADTDFILNAKNAVHPPS